MPKTNMPEDRHLSPPHAGAPPGLVYPIRLRQPS